MDKQAHRGRLIAVGDIHGCADELAELLARVALTPRDTVVTLGDYVDRGPDSRGVIEQLIQLGERCRLVPLLGNHDEALIVAVDGLLPVDDWEAIGGRATLDSYGGKVADIPAAAIEFLRNCRAWYETAEHFFVHGNYVAELPLDQQPPDVLRWTSLRDYRPTRHCSGKRAVVGHTPQMAGRPLDLGHLIDIDTGCCYGGWLTAFEVHSGEIWQVASRQPNRTK
ncbi:MAG: serine/threonine protein phosphatase [Pirellulales bacterium]|nr:serine/threonine protein phosphatase [Pirellulales bacterium]